MIISFKSKELEIIWNGIKSKKIPTDIQERVRRKLRMLNNSHELKDLLIPTSNMLENLKGNRKGQYSIRINDQWRLCFKFENCNCYNVEIVDYH